MRTQNKTKKRKKDGGPARRNMHVEEKRQTRQAREKEEKIGRKKREKQEETHEERYVDEDQDSEGKGKEKNRRKILRMRGEMR